MRSKAFRFCTTSITLLFLVTLLLPLATAKAAETVTPVWYLAEGSTDYGFETLINIANPNDEKVKATVYYMTGSGKVFNDDVELAPLSQTTLMPADRIGHRDFSTKIEAARDGMGWQKTICVDRRMTWKDQAGNYSEGHSSVGVTAPATVWYLPEGSAKWGFTTWLLIQNPQSKEADCAVTYMTEEDGPLVVHHKVPAKSRKTFNMQEDIGPRDASIKVESDVPVIPERAMYRNSMREGHDSIGTTTPAQDFYLAEGATGYPSRFITYVLVQNPHGTPTDIAIDYMTKTGAVVGPTFQMPPQSRRTIRVNDQLGLDVDVSTHVRGSQPIIAERSMYWTNGTGEACHDSIGMAAPHGTFYLPDGYSGAGYQTWTLVQNPNASAVDVEISYLGRSGAKSVTFKDSIPANARKTYNMADRLAQGYASITVTSRSAGKKVMVERSMYWDNQGAGTDTIGGFGD